GTEEPGVPDARRPTAQRGPRLHPGTRVFVPSPSRAGEATHSCTVPTLRAASERRAEGALGLGRKFAEAGGKANWKGQQDHITCGRGHSRLREV
ncbi:unnamed protein product, partial [Gulo gulo]